MRRALVLSGGGARGAYEVGVLEYILTELGEKEGLNTRFDIVSGTSVGAINACFLASRADVPHYDIRRLHELWCDLRVRDWLQLSYLELIDVLGGVTGFRRIDMARLTRRFSGGRLGGLLNTSGLDEIVRREVSRNRISRNISEKRLTTLTVSATEVATGRTVCFVESGEPLPQWSRDPRRVARATLIRSDHALASAAIPFLFPAVPVDGNYYCDGGLRQPTPLSPALRLGADRVLVISLRYDFAAGTEREHPATERERRATERMYPNAMFLFGKLLNALLLDPVEYDLAVLERVNRILKHGTQVYGPSFQDELNQVVHPLRGKPYRIVDDIHVRPSEDIGRMAVRAARQLERKDWGRGPAARLFRRLGQTDTESDFLSYLLFDGVLAEPLIALGFADAATHRDELIAFFSDEPFPY